MATEFPGYTRSYAASADLSANQYFLVKHHTVKDQVALVAAITDLPVGLLQNKPGGVGRAAEVMAIGWSKANVSAGTDIAIGDPLGPHTDGRLITKAPLADDKQVCAIAEEAAASASGDIITVMVFPTRWVLVA